MATITIGAIAAEVTFDSSGNKFEGNIRHVDYNAGALSILRISSSTDSNKGAIISGSRSPFSAMLDGEVSILNGMYGDSFRAEVTENSFEIPLPGKDIKIGDASSLLKFKENTFTIISTVSSGVDVKVLGVSISPSCTYIETTKLKIQSGASFTVSRSYKVTASYQGLSISSPTITISASASSGKGDILERMKNIAESLLRDNILSQQLIKLGTEVASYVSKYGSEIVDAIESIGDLFDSSSSSPPPPVLINPHADAININSATIQWGQAVSTSDGDQAYPLAQKVGIPISALLTCLARPNVYKSLCVGTRKADSFVINRDNSLDYQMPFHWVGISESAAGKPNYGMQDKDGIRICWGSGVSTSDSKEVFEMTGAFGGGPFAIVITPDQSGIQSNFSLHSYDGAGGTFSIDRDSNIDGKIKFTYIAIGSVPNATTNPGYLKVDDGVIQWGRGVSTVDHEQHFKFNTPFKSMDFSVVATVDLPNVRSSLSQSRPINEEGFVIDRHSRIDGSIPFYWIAVGR